LAVGPRAAETTKCNKNEWKLSRSRIAARLQKSESVRTQSDCFNMRTYYEC
jgi:hypothetical protein